MAARSVPFSLPLGVIGLFYAGLGARLVELQVLDGEENARVADRVLVREEASGIPRGRILDRRGEVLALSYPVLRLEASPANVTIRGSRDPEAIGRVLAPALGRSEREVRRRLASEASYRVLARGLRSAQAAAVREILDREKILGIRFAEECARAYPFGDLGGHVLGHVDAEGSGGSGVEARYDPLLRGESGSVRSCRRLAGVIQRAEGGLEAVAWGEPADPPRSGMDLVLTIDAKVSSIAQRRIEELVESYRPDWASVVVLDPRDGSVLALENAPRFDPSEAGRLATSRPQALRNPAVENVVEPGSIFKPFVYATGLEERAFDPEEWFDCEGGEWPLGNRTVRDHRPFLEPLRGIEVLAFSSNIGMAKIGLRLGRDRMRPALLRFGMGERTGIELPGEAAPRVTSRRDWTEEYTTVSVSFGYEIAISPLRLATSMCAFANGGVVPSASVVAGLLDEQGIFRPRVRQPGKRAVGGDVLDRTIEAMEEVFRSGTASRLPKPSFRIAGKSGTSKPPGARGEVRYLSSFVCFGPVEDAAALVLVTLQNPKGGKYYGSEVAAPAAVAVLEETLVVLGKIPAPSPAAEEEGGAPARRVFPEVALAARGGR
jgi:cell division protein FtsI/penicillin-binding protein 2